MQQFSSSCIPNCAQFDRTICEVLCSATAGSKMEDEFEGGEDEGGIYWGGDGGGGDDDDDDDNDDDDE
jgi:hypothetical protein